MCPQLKLWFSARIHLVQELGGVEANPKMIFQLLENVCGSSTTITCNTNSPPHGSVDSALERLPKPGLIGESMYRRRYSGWSEVKTFIMNHLVSIVMVSFTNHTLD